MFGISAFAQSPFAALGGNAFPVDLAESFTLSDVYAAQVAFEGLYDESFDPRYQTGRRHRLTRCVMKVKR